MPAVFFNGAIAGDAPWRPSGNNRFLRSIAGQNCVVPFSVKVRASNVECGQFGIGIGIGDGDALRIAVLVQLAEHLQAGSGGCAGNPIDDRPVADQACGAPIESAAWHLSTTYPQGQSGAVSQSTNPQPRERRETKGDHDIDAI
jgi:hypothetical protein